MAEVSLEEKLARFRRSSLQLEAERRWELARALRREGRVGGGAPQLVTALTALKGSVTNNTFLGPQSVIGADNRGPFGVDYFETFGATWTMEAMGILGVTAATTPTIAFRVTFGTVFATISTMLAQHTAITAISGVANVDWYLKIFGVTKLASGAASTMLVTGWLIAQIATAAAGNNTTPLKNATPPTAVVTDLSGSAFLDLQATWSASAVGNSLVTNFYELLSLWS
jgi:hypothetical protein